MFELMFNYWWMQNIIVMDTMNRMSRAAMRGKYE